MRQDKLTRTIERYTDFPLPVYAFLPGINLHPSKSQGKHMPDIFDDNLSENVDDLQKSLSYLYAVDLFNLGYYWEVHEVLEKLWLKAGKISEQAVFLKGLIQLSVALLKVKTGNIYGAERLYDKAVYHLQKKVYGGFDVKNLLTECEKFIRKEIDDPPKISLYEIKR